MKENELLMNPWIRELWLFTYFSEISGRVGLWSQGSQNSRANNDLGKHLCWFIIKDAQLQYFPHKVLVEISQMRT